MFRKCPSKRKSSIVYVQGGARVQHGRLESVQGSIIVKLYVFRKVLGSSLDV